MGWLIFAAEIGTGLAGLVIVARNLWTELRPLQRAPEQLAIEAHEPGPTVALAAGVAPRELPAAPERLAIERSHPC